MTGIPISQRLLTSICELLDHNTLADCKPDLTGFLPFAYDSCPIEREDVL
jgi:hypothetical protein